MKFLVSWLGSYLKAVAAASVIFTGAAALVTFLRGGDVTIEAAAQIGFWIFAGVATTSIIPALIVSAGPEMVGVHPNRIIYSVVGASIALAALAGVTMEDVQAAQLLDSSKEEITAWLSQTFQGVSRVHMAVFAFAGAASGGALARSRAKALNAAQS
ncbi:MAG: hypothetical protein AAGA22_03815 [Pseudomonadota bacterium]